MHNYDFAHSKAQFATDLSIELGDISITIDHFFIQNGEFLRTYRIMEGKRVIQGENSNNFLRNFVLEKRENIRSPL